MANWDNDYDDETSLNSLRLGDKEYADEEEVDDKDDKDDKDEGDEGEGEGEEKDEDKDDDEGEDKDDKDDKDDDDKEDEDDIVDLDAEEEAEKEEAKKAEEEALAKKEEEDKEKTDEELAAEKEAEELAEKEAEDKAKEEEAKAKEEEAKANEEETNDDHDFEIVIDDKTYDAKSAEVSIKKLNEIESDEFLKNLIEHRSNGGDVLDYFKANSSREDEMSNLDLAKYSFENDPSNTGLGQEELNLLWDEKLESDYKISTDKEFEVTERELKVGQAILKRDAAKAKADIKSEKDKFKIAEPKENTKVSEDLAKAALDKAQIEQTNAQAKSLKDWNDEVDNHKVTKTLKEKGMIVIEVDGKKLGYKSPDADGLIDINKDLNKFLATATDKDGHIKLDVFSEIMAFAQDRSKFKSDLVKFGRMQEKKTSLKKSRNIESSDDKTTTNTNKKGKGSMISEMKKAGWGSL